MRQRACALDLVRQPMSDPIIRKGEHVTCTNGYVICEVLEDIHLGDMNWGAKMGEWTQLHPMAMRYPPSCAQCGGAWFRDGQMHIEDGTWRPGPPKGRID